MVRRCLGGGHAGLVYVAYDRERHAEVALKTLKNTSPQSVYRLKQEFRSLAELSHPNLVSMHELVAPEVQGSKGWFISMEMIKGVDFARHVRGEELPRPLSSATWMSDELERVLEREDAHVAVEQALASPPPDYDLLRDAVVQLLSGLAALHQGGKLHCDVKPSNALVTSEGRVVLLDFGLVYDTDRSASELSRVDKVKGTVAYMAPEVAAGGAPSAAADLYAAGVMLFQGLTGRLPFGGSLVDMLKAKAGVAPAPLDLVAGVPGDLNRLCVELLAADPTRRPTAVAALLELGKDPSMLAVRARAKGRERVEGRREERQQLQEAWNTARVGRAVLVEVVGPAGIGRTAVVHAFLKGLRRDEEVTLLRGRCFQREAMPYKALDAMVDGLRRRLLRLPEADRAALMPEDTVALARLFPALGETTDQPVGQDVGPAEARRAGFLAVQQLLRRMAKRKPVLIFLDDVQWGDADSARLLASLFAGLPRSRWMVVLSWRQEETGASPFLQTLHRAPVMHRIERRRMEIKALPLATAMAVARGLLGDRVPDAAENAVRIAEASGGLPYLMVELASYLREAAERGEDLPDDIRPETILRRRVAMLSSAEQQLLEAVVAAGRALPLRVFAAASGVGSEAEVVLGRLRHARLVRTERTPFGELVEAYHGQLGQIMSAGGDSAVHLRLAKALEADRWEDQEALMGHWLAGGRPGKAARCALEAARRAEESLAFEQAARLYGTALDLGAEEEGLNLRRAEALAQAGRGKEAAASYLREAEQVPLEQARAYRGKAAEQLILQGHFDEGMELMSQALADVGLKRPRSRGWLAFRLALMRWWLRRWRGLGFKERAEEAVPPGLLRRADTCWSVALALSSIDPVQGVYFHTLGFIAALEAGEPGRLLRSFAMELPIQAQSPRASWEDYNRVLKQAQRLQSSLGQGQGLLALGEGMAAYLSGRFKNGYRVLRQSERTLAPGAFFEQSMARLFALRALLYTGELERVAEERGRLLAEAEQRGDVILGVNLRVDYFALLALARGERDTVRADISAVQAAWTQDGGHYQHLYVLRAQVALLLYEDRAKEAYEVLLAGWPALEAGHVLRNPLAWVSMAQLRGRLALETGDRATAKRWLSKLDRASHRVAKPWAATIRAGWLYATDLEAAVLAAKEAEKGFLKLEMQLQAAAARRLVGVWTQDAALVRQGEGRLRHRGVVDPEAFVRAVFLDE